jgi:hypothetical protein
MSLRGSSPKGNPPAQLPRDYSLARISAAMNNLTLAELDLAPCQIECVSAHRSLSRGHARRGG